MSEEKGEERTEQPTEKRRREFREKGQVAQSREVNNAMLMTGSLMLWSFYAPVFWNDLKSFLAVFWGMSSEYDLTRQSVGTMLLFVAKAMGALIWPLLVSCLLLGFLSSYLQIGWLLTVKPLQPDFTKLDPIKGMGKFVSKRSFFEMAKSFGKVFLIATISYWVMWDRADRFLVLAETDLESMIGFMAETMFDILLRCCILLIGIASADYFFTRWEMEKKMKMTKQEVKEENKETEGDPLVKQRVRSLQREMSRKRMMSQVPLSDVTITNPTHYAVSILYKKEKMKAPVVVAKGMGHLALKIKEVAKSGNVPLVENPPVARALYKIELGQAIPNEMFQVVAEILAYVYKLKKRKM